MSFLDFEREFSAEISEKSTLPELIGLLISSFRQKEFKLVEKILIEREEKLEGQLKKALDRVRLFEKLHGEAELRISEVQDDLNRLKDENVELRKEKLENAQKLLEYEERVTNLEKVLANLPKVDVSEIRTLAVTFDEEGCHSKTLEMKKDSMDSHSSNHIGMEDACDIPRVGMDGLKQEERKGCNDGTSKMRKGLLDDHSNAQIGVEDACDTHKVRMNDLKQENNDDNSYAAASRSINKTCDRPRPPIVVEIIESDDNAPGEEKPHVSKAWSSEVHLSKKGVTFMSNDGPIQDNIGNNPLDSLPSKRKRSLTDTDDSQMVKKKCLGLQIPSRKLAFHSSDDSSDYSFSDSEDECSESSIEKMIESLRKDCRKSQKMWNSAKEMVLDFLNNNELCMNAVCALYRKGISKKSGVMRLQPFDEMSGKDLAEYLIDGDPQHRLKRTVSEVQEKDSTILDRCKELAYNCKEALFVIYQNNEDPFFPPRS